MVALNHHKPAFKHVLEKLQVAACASNADIGKLWDEWGTAQGLAFSCVAPFKETMKNNRGV